MNRKYGYLLIVREWGKDLGFNLEIERCLREYHGNENVEVVIIPNDANILEFFVNLIHDKMPKRIYVDTRIFIVDAAMPCLTRHLAEVSAIHGVLKSSQVTPVCILTDALKAPGYLLVAELLVHGIGVLLPGGADSPIRGFSRKSRTKPTFNPISLETGELLKKSSIEKSKDLYLGGLMYEPRKTYIDNVIKELKDSGIDLTLLPKKSNSYSDYLTELSRFKIILNTNFVVNSEAKNMVARNIEAMHVGSLLLTQNTTLLAELFTEGEHYINIESASDAATKIKYFLTNQDEAQAIAKSGQEKALKYAKEQYFMSLVNKKIDELGLEIRQ